MNSRTLLMTTASVSLILIAALVVLGINIKPQEKNPDKNKENDNIIENNPVVVKTISCTGYEYQENLNANLETTISLGFDRTNYIDTANITLKYMYYNQSDYDMWKQAYENPIDINIPGVTTRYEFDDVNRIITSVMNQKYSEIPQGNINNEFPAEYEAAKQYFINSGYSCSF